MIHPSNPVQHKPEVVNRKKKTVYIKQVIKIYIVIFFMFENVMRSPPVWQLFASFNIDPDQ